MYQQQMYIYTVAEILLSVTKLYTSKTRNKGRRRVGSVSEASACRTTYLEFESNPGGWLKPALCVNVPLPLFVS